MKTINKSNTSCPISPSGRLAAARATLVLLYVVLSSFVRLVYVKWYWN